MMTILSNLFSFLVPFLVVLGVLVLLHEAGHFLTARAFGVRPYIFSFGIGWRVAGLQRRGGRLRFSFGPLRTLSPPEEDAGTDFRISLLPFGGYVMLQGESLSEHVTGDPREFRTRPRWQQLIVYVAGVALNIALAFLVMTSLYWKRGFVPQDPAEPRVVQTVSPGSPADKAGLRPGDRLLEIEGRDARDSIALYDLITTSPGATRAMLIERDGERKEIRLTIGMDEKYHLGIPGFGFQDLPLIQRVVEGGPASRGGIRAGDRIVRINERESPSAGEVQAIIRSSGGSRVQLVVERGGTRVPIEVRPEGAGGSAIIGIEFPREPVRQVGLAGAVMGGGRFCWGTAQVLFISVRKLLRGDISARAMSGPLELSKFSREAWREGGLPFLEFLAFVSVQLGIINLFPVPGLDGGQMLILVVEGGLRRELPDRVKQWVITSGFAALLLFAGFVVYFDVVKAIF